MSGEPCNCTTTGTLNYNKTVHKKIEDFYNIFSSYLGNDLEQFTLWPISDYLISLSDSMYHQWYVSPETIMSVKLKSMCMTLKIIIVILFIMNYPNSHSRRKKKHFWRLHKFLKMPSHKLSHLHLQILGVGSLYNFIYFLIT